MRTRKTRFLSAAESLAILSDEVLFTDLVLWAYMNSLKINQCPGASLRRVIRVSVPASLLLAGIFVAQGCRTSEAPDTRDVPEWSQTAIWYQIFVERFRNGDPDNDPTPHDMVGADPGPACYARGGEAAAAQS